MVSRSTLYAQLDALESELKEKIIPHLEKAVADNNDLVFCVKDFNPFGELKDKTDKTTETLVKLGARILVLKNKLGEPAEGSIAEKICWYCRQWGKLKNAQHKCTQGLAQQFLDEIKIQNS